MKRAFTLVELLVVVLIIGILTAVAIPMYQSAVDKTHWSTLLPTARALKNAEEAYLMATNAYTDNEDALDVAATEGDATYQLQMPDSAARYVIRGSTTKLPNVRLAQYLKDNASYEDLLFCEAATDNERANKLCEKTLNGQKVFTTSDSYNAYLIDSPCRKGTGYLDDGRCGYENTQGQTMNNGEICIARSGMYACKKSVVNEGGICKDEGSLYFGCASSVINNGGICSAVGNFGCEGSTINEGGTCIGEAGGGQACRALKVNGGTVICDAKNKNYCGLRSTFDGGICVGDGKSHCINSTFKNGAVCYANAQNACGVYAYDGWSTFDETSCCCGTYCPASAPKCDSSRCDPQYMK